MKLKITSDFLTDRGLRRSINEDSVYSGKTDGLYVYCVADGMGGHSYGEKASGEIVKAVKEWLQNFYPEKYHSDFQEMLDDFDRCLRAVNLSIYQKYNQKSICGSTVVTLLIYEDSYAVLSLGDSRVYRKRLFRMDQLTRDDTWQNSSLVPVEFSEHEIRRDSRYDKLVRAVGTEKDAVFRRTGGHVKRGDRFFLCSDGVYKVFDVNESGNIRCQGDEKECLDRIKEIVYKRGAPDNLSMILVSVHWF